MPEERETRTGRSLSDALQQMHAGTNSDEPFRQLFQQSFECIWVLAPDGTIVEVNEAALAVMAVRRPEVLGTPIWAVSFWAGESQLPAAIHAAVVAAGTGACIRFDAEVDRPASPVTLDLSFKPITDGGGRAALVIVEGRHVGARARAERALRESEARLDRIVSIAADAIISMDEAHRVTMFNHGAENIFGYTAADVIGKPLDVLLPAGVDATHAHAVREFAAGTVEARRMGERREIFGRRKTGDVFRAEASISKVTIAGRVVFTAVVRDVSERWTREQERARLLEAATRAREDVERERERIAFLSDVSEAMSASLDYDEQLRTAARLLVPRSATFCLVDVAEDDGTIRRVEVIHAHPHAGAAADFLRGLSLARDRPYVTRRAMETGEPDLIASLTDEHLHAVTQNDRHFDALSALALKSMLCVPLAARGNTIGVIALGRDESLPAFSAADVTLCTEMARRAALAIDNARLFGRAQEAVRQRDRVLGVVSHDLRNPLSAIGMCLVGLENPSPDEPAQRAELLGAIRGSVDWANRLIADLLDVASIEAGKLSFEPRATDSLLLVARAAHMFEHAAGAKEVRLATVVPDDVPPVMADPNRILQTLSNLISNALKYTPSGRTITVSAMPAEAGVVFSVADEGPGIAQDDVPHLFDRFWRAPHGAGGGTGLGLAIAKGIVAAHGGRIWVEPQIGAGCTFNFTVPRADIRSVHSARPEDDRPFAGTGVRAPRSGLPEVRAIGRSSAG
jgi:PAS domain S-box-containing protein